MCTSLALCLLEVSEILPGWADLIWNGFIRGVVRFEITLASFNTRLYFPANGLEILRFRDLLGCKIKQWTRFLISSRKIFLRNVFQFEVNGTVWNTIDALAMYIDSMVIQRIELILDSCRNIWNWGNVKHWIWNTQTHFFLPMLNQTRGEIGTYLRSSYFQSNALPTKLSRHVRLERGRMTFFSDSNISHSLRTLLRITDSIFPQPAVNYYI